MADQVRKGQGAGLGLAIVKSLMEKMGGDISANLVGDKISIICEWKNIK